MRSALLFLFPGIVIAATTGHADTRSAAMGVSVTVTRSCDVTVTVPEVGVTCRTQRPSTVQVRIGKEPPSLRTLRKASGTAPVVSSTVPVRRSGTGTRIVTVNF